MCARSCSTQSASARVCPHTQAPAAEPACMYELVHSPAGIVAAHRQGVDVPDEDEDEDDDSDDDEDDGEAEVN